MTNARNFLKNHMGYEVSSIQGLLASGRYGQYDEKVKLANHPRCSVIAQSMVVFPDGSGILQDGDNNTFKIMTPSKMPNWVR